MKQKYIHKGIRLVGSKKVQSLQLLDENGVLSDADFTVAGTSKDASLLGYIFEANIDLVAGKITGMPKSSFDNVGNWKDKPEFIEWKALQVRALAKAKHVPIKTESINELCTRLHNERLAFHAALDRGDFESAQAIKDLVLLALDKKIKHNESEKYIK